MPDPFQQFRLWFQEATTQSHLHHPNAMALATVDSSGQPKVRMVLLKEYSEQGFLFFTNYRSPKAQELTKNSRAALCFYWDPLGKQIRIEGSVEKISAEESEKYFHSRPRLSQIGALTSEQSQEIPSRKFLEDKFKELEKRFAAQTEIPYPSHWGGYCLRPDYFEFWSQGEHRLHDREVFSQSSTGWIKKRLSP